MKKTIVMVVIATLFVGVNSLSADDYARAEMGMGATMVPLSRAVCHRATGNLSSCTSKLNCGGHTLWPTASQMKKFSKYSGKIQVTSQDQSRKLCRIK